MSEPSRSNRGFHIRTANRNPWKTSKRVPASKPRTIRSAKGDGRLRQQRADEPPDYLDHPIFTRIPICEEQRKAGE